MATDSNAILLISNEPWGEIWYSKHHYAWNLAKYGFRVYFVNPSTKWRIGYLLKRPLSFNKIEANLIVVNYGNILPVLYPWKRLSTRWNDKSVEKRICKLFKLNNPLIWSFDPFRFAFNFTASQKIYHVVDPYHLTPLDRQIANRASLVVMSSPKYHDHYRMLNTNNMVLPHGIPTLDKSSELNKVDLPDKYSILVGNIGNDLNYHLLACLVDTGLPMVIVGNVRNLTNENKLKWKKIIQSPGVHVLPSKPLKVLQSYIESAVVGLVVYEFTYELEIYSRTPLKILNYVLARIPVLSSCHPDIDLAINNGIYHAYDMDSFLRLYRLAFDEGLVLDKSAYDQYASKNSYPKLIRNILRAIED